MRRRRCKPRAPAGAHRRPTVDEEPRIVGRIGPLTAAAAKNLADHLQEPVWPDSIPSGQWGPRRGEPVHLTHVEPVVVEVAAGIAWDGRRFRHTVRYLRARQALDAGDVELPRTLHR